MFFSRRPAASGAAAHVQPLRKRLLPPCYDEFRGTKIHNIIDHPKPEGDRIFLSVQYAGSAAVKAHGARWDPDVRRWWYWSGSTQQLSDYYDTEAWLDALEKVHSRSVFAEWPIDVDFMRVAKSQSLNIEDFFDYYDCGNPVSVARAK